MGIVAGRGTAAVADVGEGRGEQRGLDAAIGGGQERGIARDAKGSRHIRCQRFDDQLEDYREGVVTITYHKDLIQGSQEWMDARCGLLTASEMHLIVTPTLKAASNDKERAHLYELLAQRITKYVEPQYISDAMLRGMDDETDAVKLYAKHYAPVTSMGFITNDKWGFTIGYSPDALVGDDGLIECKSRAQKYQIQTITENQAPPEYMIQIQTALLVTGREWIDFVSYSGGLPMFVKRCPPIKEYQAAILGAAIQFETRLAEKQAIYDKNVSGFIPTERKIVQEIF